MGERGDSSYQDNGRNLLQQIGRAFDRVFEAIGDAVEQPFEIAGELIDGGFGPRADRDGRAADPLIDAGDPLPELIHEVVSRRTPGFCPPRRVGRSGRDWPFVDLYHLREAWRPAIKKRRHPTYEGRKPPLCPKRRGA